MIEELVPISFHKILQSHAYTVIILGTERKKFAIYTDPQVGRLLQQHLTQEESPRPYTHDLMNFIFQGLNIKVLQVVIHDVNDTVYFARLFLEQTLGEERRILEIDSRPSDCITLALIHKVPVLCRKEVLEKAVPFEE